MKDKYYANKGVKRNKTPLQNKVYKIKFFEPKYSIFNPEDIESVKERFEKTRFKDKGCMNLLWKYERDETWNFHGGITPEQLKSLLGEKQWSKFCQGKTEFIIQRRINGKNL